MGGMGRQKLFEFAKGYQGRGKNVYSVARSRVNHALLNQYKTRKEFKRDQRMLWVQNINAGVFKTFALVLMGELMSGLAPAHIELNRKILSELATFEPYSFKAVVEELQKHATNIHKPSTKKFFYPTPEKPLQQTETLFYKQGESEPMVPTRSYKEEDYKLD
ncbi:putative 50S ribosomal protein L20 [Planoprotostelium fungivorum]|uniref:Putative 50S ribosomal protein L20 n=1 Tax=Planoprotostelium fungivorum TaxID=1890364 RepID=A0A2P6NED9_9EUKA|nr:putative 50S ribosomal protein L20 [Planoprotostelium fungivorum]